MANVMARSLRIAAVLLVVLAVASCARKPEYKEAPVSADEIRISIGHLEEGKPQFHAFEHEGSRIDFFVLRINGRIESYFDACAKCYPQKKGYRAQGDKMVCRACGQRFDMDKLEGLGSCHPLLLEGHMEGDSYVISKEDLIKGARYF